MKLVIYPAVDNARLTRIQAAIGQTPVVNSPSEAAATAEMATADAFFGKLTPRLLAAAPQLAWVQSPTASLEHYLFPELIAHPCVLTNMRGIYSDVVAEHVLGLMLCFARNLHLYARQQSTGRWDPMGGAAERSSFLSGPGESNAIDRVHRQLAGQTLGIVGYGGIGREVARLAIAHGMQVLAVDTRAASDHPEARLDHQTLPCASGNLPPTVAPWTSERLNELLAASDYVVIAAPHTPPTERLFDADRLRQMKRSAYLINVGRGATIDTDALTQALHEGALAGAGLDVVDPEPLPSDHPLWRFPQVIITPHVAANSLAIAPRHLAVLINNIGRFRAGLPLENVVDKTKWY